MHTVEAGCGLVRLAFYGRYSTQDRQNPATSYAWQRNRAEATVTGEGRITEEFFDRGQSRQLAWHLRPEAVRQMKAVKDLNRNFDAIVIGSHERAFYGNQASLVLPLLEKHGVALWMPEVGGPVTSGHDELVALLGILAKREIIRARARTVGAMTALVRDCGRYVGGRPAYGYRLARQHRHQRLAQLAVVPARQIRGQPSVCSRALLGRDRTRPAQTEISARTTSYTLELEDITEDWTYTVTKSLSADESSAEAIMEMAADELSKWRGTDPFTSVTVDGSPVGDYSSSDIQQMEIENGSTICDTTSSLSSGEDFTTTWKKPC